MKECCGHDAHSALCKITSLTSPLRALATHPSRIVCPLQEAFATAVAGGAAPAWTHVRVLGGRGGPGGGDGQLHRPRGLRFSEDGGTLVVADSANHRVSLFQVDDGTFLRHLGTSLAASPVDVEALEGGWLVATDSDAPDSIEFVGVDGGQRVPLVREDRPPAHPSALALLPGIGLAVKESSMDSRSVCVFGLPDAVALASLSLPRGAWMGAVVRAALRRAAASFPAYPPPHLVDPVSVTSHAAPLGCC